MTTDEFDLIAGAIKASYPASKILADATAMRFWYAMLKDVDYPIAENAVMEFASTSTFPPTIADIRKLCMERTKGPLPSFDEAWGSVQKAMRMFFYDDEEVYQIHPKKDQYVNKMENCLHLWKPIGFDMTDMVMQKSHKEGVEQ